MAELFWLLFEKKKILHSSLCCFITCLKMPMCLSLPVFSLATAVYLGFDQCVWRMMTQNLFVPPVYIWERSKIRNRYFYGVIFEKYRLKWSNSLLTLNHYHKQCFLVSKIQLLLHIEVFVCIFAVGMKIVKL